MSSNTGIEHRGRHLGTTAANAQAEAPTSATAREVEANADHVKDVALDAASTAQSKGPSLTGNQLSPLDQLQQQASKTLNNAVAQGQHDVEAVKSTGASEYVDQAKTMASDALSTVQSYLPESIGGQTGQAKGANGSSGPDIVASLQSGAGSALETTKEYLATAQETAKPHIENAKGVAQGFLGTAGTQVSDTLGKPSIPPKDIPATSAPLESGPHSVDTPYPSNPPATKNMIGQTKAA